MNTNTSFQRLDGYTVAIQKLKKEVKDKEDEEEKEEDTNLKNLNGNIDAVHKLEMELKEEEDEEKEDVEDLGLVGSDENIVPIQKVEMELKQEEEIKEVEYMELVGSDGNIVAIQKLEMELKRGEEEEDEEVEYTELVSCGIDSLPASRVGASFSHAATCSTSFSGQLFNISVKAEPDANPHSTSPKQEEPMDDTPAELRSATPTPLHWINEEEDAEIIIPDVWSQPQTVSIKTESILPESLQSVNQQQPAQPSAHEQEDLVCSGFLLPSVSQCSDYSSVTTVPEDDLGEAPRLALTDSLRSLAHLLIQVVSDCPMPIPRPAVLRHAGYGSSPIAGGCEKTVNVKCFKCHKKLTTVEEGLEHCKRHFRRRKVGSQAVLDGAQEEQAALRDRRIRKTPSLRSCQAHLQTCNGKKRSAKVQQIKK